jgi:hypothetical protein
MMMVDNASEYGAFRRVEGREFLAHAAQEWGGGFDEVNFSAGRVVPIANENRPASISVLACITY